MLRVSVVTLFLALGACAALTSQPATEVTIEPTPAPRQAPPAKATPAIETKAKTDDPGKTASATPPLMTASATATTTTPAPASKATPAPTTAIAIAAPGPAADADAASASTAIWPPRMPAGIDFEDVHLGRWADYEESYLGAATIKERVALVYRGAEGVTLETTTEMASGEKTVFATVFAPGKNGGWRVARNVFQVADDDPMEAPTASPAQQPYPRADPKKLIGIETVTVRAGTFRAKHYRYRTAYGERVDYWTDDTVMPIGIVKLEAEQKQLPSIRAGFVFELVALGSGAIPQVTKPARAFDVTVLKKRGLPAGRQTRLGPQPPVKVVP